MIDEEKILELRQKHGPVEYMRTQSDDEIVVRIPNSAEWGRFQADIKDPTRTVQAPDVLLRNVCVFPDLMTLDSMLSRRPGLVQTFVNRVVDISLGGGLVEKKSY